MTVASLKQAQDLMPGEFVCIGVRPTDELIILAVPITLDLDPTIAAVIGEILAHDVPTGRMVIDTLDHGSLTVRYPVRSATRPVPVYTAHHPMCDSCGDFWPCRETRIEHATARFAKRVQTITAHLGDEEPG